MCAGLREALKGAEDDEGSEDDISGGEEVE